MPYRKSLLAKVNFVHYLFLLSSLIIFLLSAFIFLEIHRRAGQINRIIERVEALETIRGDLERARVFLIKGDRDAFERSLVDFRREALSLGLQVKDLNGGDESELSLLLTDVDSRVGEELQSLWKTFKEDRRWLSGIFLLYLLLSLSGSFFIMAGHYLNLKKVLKPVEDLTRAAKAFARGERGVKVSIASEDELGELARTFNEMAETIRAKEESLVRLNSELEERVRRRTEELERTCKELKETQERLIQAERLAVAGEVSSRVSHSILTPLSALVVNFQALRSCFDREKCPTRIEDCARSFTLMEEELKRICEMVGRYGRFTKKPRPLKKEELSIEEVIDETILLIYNKAEKAGVRIEKRYHHTPKVSVDRGQMREVFLNLSDNAIEAMEDGGTITFETAFVDGRVAVRVTDNGCGMDQETLRDLFIPFKTTKPSGLGLGMTIVKQVVESHGGEILCESSVGEGTTFTILLPPGEGDDTDHPDS